MAGIKAFKGVRYNLSKVKIEDVVAPPYDVISEKDQDKLYERSEANVVRLILNKINETDNDTNNRYTRSAEVFRKLQESKILMQDDKPAIYVYVQDFEFDGKKYQRTGFLALLKQEPLFGGTIYPHERTLSKPKADRLNLTRACKANFSPIFGLYNDETKEIATILQDVILKDADIDFCIDNGECNRIWIVKDAYFINKIKEALQDKKIFIADGHHRYETALNYTKEMREKGIKGNYDYVLAFLCDMEDKGLAVFPTHRIVKYGISTDEFLNKLEKYFYVREISEDTLSKEMEQEFKNGNISFGFYNGSKYVLLTLKNKENLKNEMQGSKFYRELDVAVLESMVFEKVLGFSKEDIAMQKHIKYVKDFNETIKFIDEKAYDFAFIMNPTRVEQIKNVALEGEVMPQKSTYFYPKLLTGLVINKFEIED